MYWGSIYFQQVSFVIVMSSPHCSPFDPLLFPLLPKFLLSNTSLPCSSQGHSIKKQKYESNILYINISPLLQITSFSTTSWCIYETLKVMEWYLPYRTWTVGLWCNYFWCFSSMDNCIKYQASAFLTYTWIHFIIFLAKHCARMLSHNRLFATPWTTACQAPLSMEFSRQEYWSGLPFPSPTIQLLFILWKTSKLKLWNC